MPDLSDIFLSRSGVTGSGLIENGTLDANLLGITAESLGINAGAPEEVLFKEVTDGSRKPYSIPTITTLNHRQNSWAYSWSNSEAWTNFYCYMTGAGKPDPERAFWFGIGRHSKQNTLSYSNLDLRSQGEIQYAKGNVVGGESQLNTYPSNTSYGPFRVRVMFLRNHHPSTPKSVSMWANHSSYWSSGYDGSGCQVGTPNTNGSYANTTDINWSNMWTYTGSTSNRNVSFSFTIPPQTTVAVLLTNTAYYWTSGNSTYRWWDHNKFYNLDSTFSDNWIQPDLKMTFAASTYNDMLNETSSYTAHRVWQRTAELFGDR